MKTCIAKVPTLVGHTVVPAGHPMTVEDDVTPDPALWSVPGEDVRPIASKAPAKPGKPGETAKSGDDAKSA